MARWVIMAVTALVLFPGAAGAVPPPPPNPSDGEISAGRVEADAKAARVGELTSRLTAAEAELQRLTDDIAFKLESANKARVDLETARTEATEAERDADAARTEADAAGRAVEDARAQLDEFAAASFQQGSTIGSLSAYFGSTSPENLLARAQLLASVGDSGLNALDDVERARSEKANKDSAARGALDLARQKQAAADQAKKDADAAQQAAVQAQQAQAGQAASIQGDKSRVEGELTQALGAVQGLEGQRAQYDQWLDTKRREDEEASHQAALNAAGHAAPVTDDRPPVAPGGSSDVETVVARAMANIGVRYSWGGGNYDGPTIGIRDGGVADSFGDYYSVGFDCSGLMMYAFAGAGVYLPHYSGYQYNAGTKVPLSEAERGDMLFWGPGGGTHVALYLGDGMMVEAPYSGSSVRVAPVRYGGIMPYATRVL